MNPLKITLTICLTICTTLAIANPVPTLIPAYFDGGKTALNKYLGSQLSYPAEAIEYEIEGEVTVSFFVLQDGSIHHPEVIKGIFNKCDEQVLEAVSNMPTWVPARRGLETYTSKQTITIQFRLEQ